MQLHYALQVDIAGSLYYWELSINTVTAVLLVLVVGCQSTTLLMWRMLS